MSTWDKRQRYVAVKCRLALGGFSGERVLELELANGETHASVAPRDFCWNASGNLVADDEPQSWSDGWVAARVVDLRPNGDVILEVPSGELLAVDVQSVKPRPTEIRPPEPNLHVPFGS